jgi:predicted RNase H-like HicB family nuclease
VQELNDKVRDYSLLERRRPRLYREVPELAGCAADGSTRQEALANVETVIAEWLETAKELGRPIPEPKSRLLSA